MSLGKNDSGREPFTSLMFGLFLLVASLAETASAETHRASLALSLPDSLLLADSIVIPVDSAQPEFRLGGTMFAGVSTAHVEELPIDPGLAPVLGLGIRSELEFAAPLYFLFEIEFASRRIDSESTFPTTGRELRQEFVFTYLQFPMLFQVSLPVTATFDIIGGFGVAPGILLSSSQTLSDGVSDTTLAIERGLEQFDFSLDVRLGAEFALTPHSGLVVDLRYLLGMQNLLILAPGEDPRVWKGRSFGLTIGWMHQLQRPIYRE